ncbi:hypothetical protein [Paenibacillus hubeiensis]|uniref:hypothetical protein n=1 Tax=Paenibacillus hubeiensis TaxID=3077330 RepID=UPI0031B9EEB4
MNDDQKRRVFQKAKSMTKEGFWIWMNQLHTRAYAKAIEHMTDAMSCHPRISKPMINQVLIKAEEIREVWDGLKMVTVDGTEGTEYKTADQIAQGFDATEAAIYKLTEPHMLHIGDKKFVIRPATAAEIEEAGRV